MAVDAEARVRLSLVDRLTGPLRRVQARLSGLTRGLGLDRIGASVRGLGKSFAGLGAGLSQSLGRLSAVGGIIGLGGAGLAAGFWSLTTSVSAVADEISKTSRQLGFGAEAFQEWTYAAGLAGVSQSTLETSLKAFGRRAGEAATGNKTMAKSFATLGVSLKDSNGNMKDTDALFSEVAAAIGGIENPLLRSKYAMDIFGRSGIDMTRLFEAGAEGMKKAREEARRTGNVMSQEAVEFSEAFNDNITRLTTRLNGLKNMVGVALMPTLNRLVTTTTAWFDANAGLVRQKITEWAERFARVIRDLLDPTSDLRESIRDMARGFSDWIDRIRPVIDFLGGPLNAALWALGAFIAGPMIAAVASLAGAFINLGIVIASTPFGWIMGAIALVAASAYVLYQEWDAFKDYWSALWGDVKSAFDSSFGEGIVAALVAFNPARLVAKGLSELVRYFTGFDLYGLGEEFIGRLGEGIASIDFAAIGTAIVDGFAGALSRTWARVTAWASESTGALEGSFDILDLAPMAVRMVDGWLTAAKGAWASIVAWAASAPQAIGDFFRLDISSMGSAAIDGYFAALSRTWARVVEWASSVPGTLRSYFDIDLTEVGRAVVASLLTGIQAAWNGVVAWLQDRISALTAMLPTWVTGGTPLNVTVGNTGQTPGSLVGSMAAPASAARGAGESAREVIRVPAEIGRVTSEERTSRVETNTVTAGTIDAGRFVAPEPLLVHQPQSIDASTHVGTISITGVDTNNAGQVRAEIAAALREQSRRISAEQTSQLSD